MVACSKDAIAGEWGEDTQVLLAGALIVQPVWDLRIARHASEEAIMQRRASVFLAQAALTSGIASAPNERGIPGLAARLNNGAHAGLGVSWK